MVVREGGVTRASEKLNISQPTISGQLRELEQALGEKLLARFGRTVALTEIGRIVYRYADEILGLDRELLQAVKGRATRQGELAVGVAKVVPKQVAYRMLEPTLRLPEPIKLVCVHESKDRLFAELVADSLDVVLADSPAPPAVKVRADSRLIGECPISIFGTEEVAAAHRRGFPGSLDGAPFLLPSEDSGLRSSLEDWFQKQRIWPRVVGTFEDSALLETFGQAGAGLFACSRGDRGGRAAAVQGPDGREARFGPAAFLRDYRREEPPQPRRDGHLRTGTGSLRLRHPVRSLDLGAPRLLSAGRCMGRSLWIMRKERIGLRAGEGRTLCYPCLYETVGVQSGDKCHGIGRRHEGVRRSFASRTPSSLLCCPGPPRNGAATPMKDADQHLAHVEGRCRVLLETAPDAMVVVNESGKIVLLNIQAERQFGYDRDELLGQPITRIIPEGLAAQVVAEDRRHAMSPVAQPLAAVFELTGRRKNGSVLPIEIMLSLLATGEGVLVTAAIRDISERKTVEAHRLQEAEDRRVTEEARAEKTERAEVTLNCIGDAVVCTDISGNITFLNVVAEALTGWPRQEAVGRPLGDVLRVLDAENREPIPNPMEILVHDDQTLNLRTSWLLIRRDGSEIPIEDSVAAILDRGGLATGSVIVFRDVSAARVMALKLSHSAEHDFLTGLPNRMLLNDRVSQAITLARRHMKQVAVLFLDLDGFKLVNDSLGHSMGDAVLQAIARCLVDCVRGSDTVSRQGGDEFVVLLSEVDGSEDVARTAERMLQAVAKVNSLDENESHITASIGISVYPDDGFDAKTLIKNADSAMYEAKEKGTQCYQFFKSAMNGRAVARHSMEESLRRAMERTEFELHFQPKINLETGAITGAEALLRWMHPKRGPLSPAEFIPVAEDCGLILPIGKWVLREACRQAREWLDAGLPPVTMAVNISAMEFRGESFPKGILAVLAETGLDPKSLELELTESVLMKHVESAKAILQTLREKGTRMAVDDFGTGYSSLSYLRTFRVDALKIDQSFVRAITTAPDDTTILTSMIRLGRSLKLRVVAEGVETSEELAFLKTHQCDEAQGYFFSRPVPAPQFANLLRAGIPWPSSVVDGRFGTAHAASKQGHGMR